MEYLTLGILAHVDAGKTTLCERLLYNNNTIKSFGRVDKNESFLDYETLERKRGITIFSKQAVITRENKSIILLDTPGHSDFVWETLSCMQVMDAALLIVDASSAMSAFTLRLFRLLRKNRIPTILFLNKSDMEGDFREDIFASLKEEGAHPVYMNTTDASEEIALCKESLLEKYLENGELSTEDINSAFRESLFNPVFYGSALKGEGVVELNEAIFKNILPRKHEDYDGKFLPFKIRYDDKNARLIYGKVIKPFKVKEKIFDEKIDEIRLYNGKKAEQISEATLGMLVALRGPENMKLSIKGDGAYTPLVEYEIIIPKDVDVHIFAEKLIPLGHEHPMLDLRYESKSSKIMLRPMGDIQLEILKDIIAERFAVEVDFRKSKVVYKETVTAPVEGVGHFEPLRHYAEAHIMLSPNPGGGVVIESDTPTDVLAANWQSQILNVLRETFVPGVLIGAELTDIRMTLVSGKAHEKHTEGGDFREATLRALRQGLMSTECVLLEPVYAFEIKLPSDCLGKLMVRLESMGAESNPPKYIGDVVSITGRFAVSKLSDFPVYITSLTSGAGDLSLEFGGYVPCENAEEIIENIGYEPERDVDFPADSVFTSHGGSDVVHWKDVPERMHIPFLATGTNVSDKSPDVIHNKAGGELSIGLEEIESILSAAGGANRRKAKSDRRSHWNRYSRTSASLVPAKSENKSDSIRVEPKEKPKEYLLVDGYNIIFAWDDLHELAEENIDSAKELLCDILDEYAAYRRRDVILVFDAYKVNGGEGSVAKWGCIDVVHTKEAETADAYIERTAHDISQKHNVYVATSDGLEQMIVRGEGAFVLSARDLLYEIKAMEEEIRKYL